MSSSCSPLGDKRETPDVTQPCMVGSTEEVARRSCFTAQSPPFSLVSHPFPHYHRPPPPPVHGTLTSAKLCGSATLSSQPTFPALSPRCPYTFNASGPLEAFRRPLLKRSLLFPTSLRASCLVPSAVAPCLASLLDAQGESADKPTDKYTYLNVNRTSVLLARPGEPAGVDPGCSPLHCSCSASVGLG